MPINLGKPAPEPMNTASYFSRISSIEMLLPITTFVSKSTPSALSPSISAATIDLGNLNSGIP